MTVDELLARESIRHTLATYNMSGDSLRVDAFVSVFTDDGILETEVFRHVGREAIYKWLTGWGHPADEKKPVHRAKFVRHNLTTSQIEFTGPDAAKGRSYFVVFTHIGPDHSGVYSDVFRKVGDKWLIAHRKVRTEWRAANSYFKNEAKEK